MLHYGVLEKGRIAMKLIVAVVLITGASPAFAANCVVQPFSYIFGADIDAHMAVKTGLPCRFGLNAQSKLQSSKIEQNASSGTVIGADDRHWIYRSRPGFSGKDSFVVLISGDSVRRSRIISGETKISVDVDVSP